MPRPRATWPSAWPACPRPCPSERCSPSCSTRLAASDELDVARRLSAEPALGRLAAAAVPGHAAQHLQVDSALRVDGDRVSAAVLQRAARAAELLLRLGERVSPLRLDEYRRAFVDRYGTGREVALLELLDPDRGLGPPSTAHRAPAASATQQLREEVLRSIAVGALRERRLAVELDEVTLAKLEQASARGAHVARVARPRRAACSPARPPTSTLATSGSLVGSNLGAQSAGRNLGRFADLLGGPAIELLAQIGAAEVAHSPDSLHAELVDLPRATPRERRDPPAIYAHEVVLGTSAGVEPRRAIPLAELVVGVSATGALRVRWPGAQGDLHVHAGHMLNLPGAPAACRFLEEVARGERMPLRAFGLGSRRGPAIPATDRDRGDRAVAGAMAHRRDDAGCVAACGTRRLRGRAERWRADWCVPRRVYLAVRDNRLLLDLAVTGAGRPAARGAAAPAGGQALVLQEPLPGPEHAWLRGPGGRYLPELVVSLIQPATAPDKPAPPRRGRPAVGCETACARRAATGSTRSCTRRARTWTSCSRAPVRTVRSSSAPAAGSPSAGSSCATPIPSRTCVCASAASRALLTGLLPRLCELADGLIADGSCLRLSP